MLKLIHITTMVLGAIRTILIFIAAISTNSGDIEGLGSIVLMLFHFLILVFAFPFLYAAIVRREEIPLWFYRIIIAESVLNSIFMLLTSNAVSAGKDQFIIYAILELLPLYILRKNRHKILFWQEN
ncbi:MAG: hypothetical protein GPJ54_02985 [Candidatus Heimdallarchaeota archaeon]|nr:hypothetical protein [Candidatus Heimdallarchaeota archaeon]